MRLARQRNNRVRQRIGDRALYHQRERIETGLELGNDGEGNTRRFDIVNQAAAPRQQVAVAAVAKRHPDIADRRRGQRYTAPQHLSRRADVEGEDAQRASVRAAASAWI